MKIMNPLPLTIAVAMLALSAGIGALGVAATGDRWEDLAPWWSAAATALAFIAAGTAARSTWETLQIERARDADRLELDKRSQALKVAAWCPPISVDVVMDPKGWRYERLGNTAALKAVNTSGLPVTNVRYVFELRLFTNNGIEGYMGPWVGRVVLEPAHEPQIVDLSICRVEQGRRLSDVS